MMSGGKNAELVEFAKTLNSVPWCDDYEKMISGIQHNPWVPELLTGRFNARKMMQNYNHIPEDATAESVMRDRDIMLRQLFGRVGKECLVEAPMTVEYGGNISVGNGFYANVNLVILDSAIVLIGNRVWFGPSASIFTATHDTDVQSRRDGVEYTKGVTIGDDCWIGGNVTIVPGVTIGKGCTVSAGSTVTKDIPDFSVAVGSPARVIKKVNPVPDVSR